MPLPELLAVLPPCSGGYRAGEYHQNVEEVKPGRSRVVAPSAGAGNVAGDDWKSGRLRSTRVNVGQRRQTKSTAVLFCNFAFSDFSDFSEINFPIYRKISKLSLVITFAYELRFRRVTRPRTRIDELYDFREQSFPEFGTYQKSNFNPYFIE